MATPARRNTVATPKPAKEKKSDVELASTSDDGTEVTIRLFGDREFLFSTDVNQWLVITAQAGRPGNAVKAIEGVLMAEPEEGESPEMASRRVGDDFHGYIGSQRGMNIDRTIKLLVDILEAVGNANPESSSD